MLGPNQGMGRRFIVPTHSNYPLSKKRSGRWDELLKTLLTSSNIPPSRYGQIYHLLLRPPKNRKQYEVTISDYLACSYMGFSVSLN